MNCSQFARRMNANLHQARPIGPTLSTHRGGCSSVVASSSCGDFLSLSIVSLLNGSRTYAETVRPSSVRFHTQWRKPEYGIQHGRNIQVSFRCWHVKYASNKFQRIFSSGSNFTRLPRRQTRTVQDPKFSGSTLRSLNINMVAATTIFTFRGSGHLLRSLLRVHQWGIHLHDDALYCAAL